MIPKSIKQDYQLLTSKLGGSRNREETRIILTFLAGFVEGLDSCIPYIRELTFEDIDKMKLEIMDLSKEYL